MSRIKIFLVLCVSSGVAWSELSALDDLDGYSIKVPEHKQAVLNEPAINESVDSDFNIELPQNHYIPISTRERTTIRDTGFTIELAPIEISIQGAGF